MLGFANMNKTKKSLIGIAIAGSTLSAISVLLVMRFGKTPPPSTSMEIAGLSVLAFMAAGSLTVTGKSLAEDAVRLVGCIIGGIALQEGSYHWIGVCFLVSGPIGYIANRVYQKIEKEIQAAQATAPKSPILAADIPIRR